MAPALTFPNPPHLKDPFPSSLATEDEIVFPKETEIINLT
jgi:hypothetical protein